MRSQPARVESTSDYPPILDKPLCPGVGMDTGESNVERAQGAPSTNPQGKGNASDATDKQTCLARSCFDHSVHLHRFTGFTDDRAGDIGRQEPTAARTGHR